MLHVTIDLFGKMFQEFIHFFAFMLHDIFSDVRSFIICFFEFMILKTTDLFCVILLNLHFFKYEEDHVDKLNPIETSTSAVNSLMATPADHYGYQALLV